MAEAAFKVKVAGRTYELAKLTLGEARILKHEFGIDNLADLDYQDPDHLVGLIFLCMRQEDPKATTIELLERVEALAFDDFEDVEEDAPVPDPTPASSEASGAGQKPGKSGTRRKTSGTRN